jgi:hypothetical protein
VALGFAFLTWCGRTASGQLTYGIDLRGIRREGDDVDMATCDTLWLVAPHPELTIRGAGDEYRLDVG